MSKKGVPPSYPVQSNQMASGSAPPSYEEAMKHQVVHGQQTVPMSGPYPSNPVHQVPAGYPPGSAPSYAYGPQYAGPPYYNNPYPQAAQVNHPMSVQQVPVAGTVYVQPGNFDGGARFNKISRPVVPPPPPGVMPNAAQLGAMQGAPVTVAQKNAKTTLNNFVMGKSDGGSTFW